MSILVVKRDMALFAEINAGEGGCRGRNHVVVAIAVQQIYLLWATFPSEDMITAFAAICVGRDGVVGQVVLECLQFRNTTTFLRNLDT